MLYIPKDERKLNRKKLGSIKITKPKDCGGAWKGQSHAKLAAALKEKLDAILLGQPTIVYNKTGSDMFWSQYIKKCSKKWSDIKESDWRDPNYDVDNWHYTLAVHNSNSRKQSVSAWLGLHNPKMRSSIPLLRLHVNGKHTKGTTPEEIAKEILLANLASEWTTDKLKEVFQSLINGVITCGTLAIDGFAYGAKLNRIRLNRSDIFTFMAEAQTAGDVMHVDKIHRFELLSIFGKYVLKTCTPIQQLPVLVEGARHFANLDMNWNS